MNLQQQWPLPSNPRPIVLVGAGGIARDAHLPAYEQAGFAVIGVSDIDNKKANSLAKEHSIETVFETLSDAASRHGVDVVYDIATPPETLPELLPQLPDGSAVLMQKPMGTDLAQARQIKAICHEKKLRAAVNFQLKFSPMMMAAKDALKQGLLGDLLEIEVHVNIFTPWHLFPFLIPMKRVEIAVHSIHYLDTIRAMAGNPKGVFARTIKDPRAEKLAQTRTSVILDYGESLRCLMSINHNHEGGRKFQSAWIRFEGTKGAAMAKLGVLYDYPNGEPDELYISTEKEKWEKVPLEGSWFIDAFKGTMGNVQRYEAGEDDSLYAGVDDAFYTMSLVEACFDAMDLQGVPLQE